MGKANDENNVLEHEEMQRHRNEAKGEELRRTLIYDAQTVASSTAWWAQHRIDLVEKLLGNIACEAYPS